MSSARTHWIKIATITLTSSLLLTACTLSASGGFLGAVLSLLIGSSLVIGLATSTSGCVEVGPCLSPRYPPPRLDMGEGSGGVDIDASEADVGPCLQPPPPEMGTPDGGPESPMGPCLSAPGPERDAAARVQPGIDEAPPGDDLGVDRAVAMARVLSRGGLPDDVVNRLKRDNDVS